MRNKNCQHWAHKKQNEDKNAQNITQKTEKMSNTDQTKNYNRWATRTQQKITIDEQHGPNQTLQ
jgi:hypothetical protein